MGACHYYFGRLVYAGQGLNMGQQRQNIRIATATTGYCPGGLGDGFQGIDTPLQQALDLRVNRAAATANDERFLVWSGRHKPHYSAR